MQDNQALRDFQHTVDVLTASALAEHELGKPSRVSLIGRFALYPNVFAATLTILFIAFIGGYGILAYAKTANEMQQALVARLAERNIEIARLELNIEQVRLAAATAHEAMTMKARYLAVAAYQQAYREADPFNREADPFNNVAAHQTAVLLRKSIAKQTGNVERLLLKKIVPPQPRVASPRAQEKAKQPRVASWRAQEKAKQERAASLRAREKAKVKRKHAKRKRIARLKANKAKKAYSSAVKARKVATKRVDLAANRLKSTKTSGAARLMLGTGF